MNSCMVKIPDEILNEVNVLVKKSGVSKEEFLSSLANFYNIKDVADSNSYYDSFTA